MKLLGAVLALALAGGDATCDREGACTASVAVDAVLLQVRGSVQTLHDVAALGAGGAEYEPSDASAGGVDTQGDGLFAIELPEGTVSSFGAEVDQSNSSIIELPGAEKGSSVAEMAHSAGNPNGVVMDIPLNSQLQVSAVMVGDPSVASAADGGSLSAAELPQAAAGSDRAGAGVDHPADRADGVVMEAPPSSQLLTSAATGGVSSTTEYQWHRSSKQANGQSPSSDDGAESESPADADLADDSTDTIDGAQDDDLAEDRGDQAALDDNDLAEDSTDGIPGENVSHAEGGHIDPDNVAPVKQDRERYDEDWAQEWRDDGNHTQASRSEQIKNSLAILGRRPQVAATAVAVALFLALRAPQCH